MYGEGNPLYNILWKVICNAQHKDNLEKKNVRVKSSCKLHNFKCSRVPPFSKIKAVRDCTELNNKCTNYTSSCGLFLTCRKKRRLVFMLLSHILSHITYITHTQIHIWNIIVHLTAWIGLAVHRPFMSDTKAVYVLS
jgi:hypothetical protein